MLISRELTIQDSEIELTYTRSSGPGGQNVNKVNSKAVLRWNLFGSTCVRPEVRARLVDRLGERLTRAGEIVIASDRMRDQGRNRQDCLERFKNLLRRALEVPKARTATRPSRSAKKKRREDKSLHALKKRNRRKQNFESS